jgi:hypothetical protein
MQIQHVTSQLQGIASARGWLLAHVPVTSSMAGYELFLKIANDCPQGRAIPLGALVAGMRHPEPVLLEQVAKMEAAGLLARPAGASAAGATVAPAVAYVPTPHFLTLLEDFSKQFDSLFIVRKDLRDRQLRVFAQHGPMRDFASTLYDRFYDLGWLYLHNFGAVCFLMASLVARVATAHGYRARIESCHAEIAKGESRYLLGAPGYAKPGQIDGHAVCILDDCMLVDFGLGNVRRGYRRDFPWGLACDFRPEGERLGGIAMTSGETIIWKNDWQSPDSEAELARYAPHLDALYEQYHAKFG